MGGAPLWVAGSGCVRRDGRNSDCRWPAETSAPTPTAHHLSADAEFAEELAIRFADVHHGRRIPRSSPWSARWRVPCWGSSGPG